MQQQAAATLRFGTAESQDESRCCAIHKFKSRINCEEPAGRRRYEFKPNGNGWRSEDRRYKGDVKSDVKDARLKRKSRRPLQRQNSSQNRMQRQKRPPEGGRYKFNTRETRSVAQQVAGYY